MNQNDWLTIFQIIMPIVVVIIASVIPIFINLALNHMKNKSDINRSINRELLEKLYIPMTEIFEYADESQKSFNIIARELRLLFSQQNHLIDDGLMYYLELFERNLENSNNDQSHFEDIEPLLLVYLQNYNILRHNLGYPCSEMVAHLYFFKKRSTIIWTIYKYMFIVSAIGYSLYFLFNFYYFQQIPSIWKLLYIPEYLLGIYLTVRFQKASVRRLNDMSYLEGDLQRYKLMYLKMICDRTVEQTTN